jgi:low affinity Fe/Cu permease
MKCVMSFLSDNAAAITALATFVIALFTILMWWLSRRIHQASLQRDKEMNEMYLNLVSAIMASGKLTCEPLMGATEFKRQRDALHDLFFKKEEQ